MQPKKMNKEKEMEDWVRKTLAPPRETARQEHEIQFEVDKLLEERLAEFKPERAWTQNTPGSAPTRFSTNPTPPKAADPPHPALFSNYAAPSRPDKKLRFLVITGLAFCIVAGSVAVIIKSVPGTGRSHRTLMTTASHVPREFHSPPADLPQTREKPPSESDSPKKNPTKTFTPDSGNFSSETSGSGAAPPPAEDEFLLEIDIPPPSLAKNSMGDPEFPGEQGNSLGGFSTLMDNEEAVQAQKAFSPPEPLSPRTDDPVASTDDEPSGAPVALEAVDTPPVVRGRVMPIYPAEAYRRGIEGTVVLNVLISESGRVLQTKVLHTIKGPFEFDTACMEALRQWRFDPAVKNGKHVRVWKPISITFKKK